MNKFKYYLIVFCVCITSILYAQYPTGYYNTTNGKVGTSLKQALSAIINASPVVITYSYVDSCYIFTDKKNNGKVWDIYSYVFNQAQNYEFTFNQDECGNYSKEGDCFNKEHLWPQSLFNQGSPMRSDLHHLFPTDGWVNNKRSNYPMGKVTNVSWTSSNGSKLGTSTTYLGYTGNVFEPVDSFKGDVARSLLYFTVRYNHQGGSWNSWQMAYKDSLLPEAINLLLTWHDLDPVSNKEVQRNNEVYKRQHNRNPFVDYPGFVDCIWRSNKCVPLESNKIENESEVQCFVDHKILKIISAKWEIEKILIFNLQGQMLEKCNMQKNLMHTKDVSEFPSGVYIIKMEGLNISVVRKIVL